MFRPHIYGFFTSHFYTWTGAETADRRNMERNLAAGISVALCPGGVQEAALVDTIPDTLRLCVIYLIDPVVQFGMCS